MSNMKKEIIKTLSLRVKSSKDLKTVSEFQNVAIFKGLDVQETLISFLESFIQYNKPPDIVLVSEKELMDRCEKLGFLTRRDTIKVYRRRGVLKDETGNWFFKNKTGHVRYNWTKMKVFLKDRKDNPNTRIK